MTEARSLSPTGAFVGEFGQFAPDYGMGVLEAGRRRSQPDSAL